MMINKISNISFKENTLSREMNSQNAILMLRDPNASVRFQQSKEIAAKADASSTNPFQALGYKLYKTFSIIKGENGDTDKVSENLKLNVLA